MTKTTKFISQDKIKISEECLGGEQLSGTRVTLGGDLQWRQIPSSFARSEIVAGVRPVDPN